MHFSDRDEAFPAKYISEYAKEELGKEEEDEDRTVASSNSFCSLHTIENLDDPAEFQGELFRTFISSYSSLF